ncbi:hypothetical protein [Plantibacter sp. 2H11-2]|uniref:hypothetical protein n=1 Tax=Plantibacter sp. 2H11-2 TaxID=3414431 RepID=UPI003CEFF1E6
MKTQSVEPFVRPDPERNADSFCRRAPATGGAAVLICINGEPALDLANGVADPDGPRPLDGDTRQDLHAHGKAP